MESGPARVRRCWDLRSWKLPLAQIDPRTARRRVAVLDQTEEAPRVDPQQMARRRQCILLDHGRAHQDHALGLGAATTVAVAIARGKAARFERPNPHGGPSQFRAVWPPRRVWWWRGGGGERASRAAPPPGGAPPPPGAFGPSATGARRRLAAVN